MKGVDSIEIDEVGNLIIKHELGEIKDNAPVSYQMVNGSRVDINCKFKVFPDMTVGFEIGENYNPSYCLVIDPLLPYSSYLGGDLYDTAQKVAVDSQGYAYISGYTKSMNFPTTPGAFRPNFDPNDSDVIFVTKVSADGSELIYSTFLDKGGETSLFVDKNGYAYICGFTDSVNFPTTPNAFQENRPSSSSQGFVTKLSPSGSELIYSTYLGGNSQTNALSIVADEAGYAYVCGRTYATDFPTTPGAFDTTPNETIKGFVTNLEING